MKSILLSIIIFFSISLTAYAQYVAPHRVFTRVLPDSADLSYYGRKNWKLATAQIVGMNIGIWAVDRYVLDAKYAYININTMKQNLKKGFVWDNDQMATNMFGHPYTGNLYYNAARSNGFNFWESGAFALGGSAMWEIFLENEYPSANDIIATPVGGMAVGEVLFSTSDLILDDRTRGTERFGREFAAFLVSPTRGLTRIINGDAWRKRSTSGRQYGVPEISIEASSGLRKLTLRDNFQARDLVWTTNINIEYGDRFDTEDKQPYDYFTVRSSFNVHSTQPVLGKFNIAARLHGTELIENEKDYLSLGFYQYFMYYDSDSISDGSSKVPYRFSAPASFGGGLMYQSRRSKSFSFDGQMHLGAILLGGTLSDHYRVDMRNYNMGSGFGAQAGFNIRYKDISQLSANYEIYRLFTWKGYPTGIDWDTVNPHKFNAQGDRSQATLHTLSLRADLKLWDKTYFTAMGHFYGRQTHYTQYPDIKANAQEGLLMLTYKF